MWNVAQVFQSRESFGGLHVPSEDFVLSGLRGVSALTGRQFLAGEEPASQGDTVSKGRKDHESEQAIDPGGKPDGTCADSPTGSGQGGMAELPGTRLGYWDTGGNGTPVVFLHPASGSALVWLYQQPIFAKGG